MHVSIVAITHIVEFLVGTTDLGTSKSRRFWEKPFFAFFLACRQTYVRRCDHVEKVLKIKKHHIMPVSFHFDNNNGTWCKWT